MAHRYRNLPNLLSWARLLGTPGLYWLAQLPDIRWAAAWFAVLGLTDALDGFLARRWNQTSEFGARLDSIADLTCYAGGVWLLMATHPETLRANAAYIGVALALALGVGVYPLLRFRRWIMLHTHMIRAAAVLAYIAIVGAFFVDTTVLIRVAAVCYALALTEQLLIFHKRGPVSADTRSLWG